MKPFRIRNIEINPPLILSPMAGVTDYTFRRLIKRRGGVGLVVSEFISVEGLTRGNPKSKRQMRFDEEERPYAVQIFGGQPARMAMGAEMAEEIGADILDVNCGCPAPKVVKNGGGSGLLRDLPRLETILKEIKRSITIPLTLKVRTGYSEAAINVVEAAKMAEQCGVEHIQVHGRTREQGYKGLANWDLIKAVKQAVQIPVSGNGDITTIDYGLARWKESGTDGILIGRGAMQNPWIFRQFQDVLEGRAPYEPDLKEKRSVLLEFFGMCREEMPEIVALGKMKQLAGQFTKGLVGGAQFRQTLYHSHSAEEILDNITTYFETLAVAGEYGDGRVESDDIDVSSCSAFMPVPEESFPLKQVNQRLLQAGKSLLILLVVCIPFAVLTCAQAKGGLEKTARVAAVPMEVRSSAGYAEVLLRRTEIEADLESLLAEYTEEYPKVKQERFELDLISKESERILAVKASDAAKLTGALGKLIVRKVELQGELFDVQQRLGDGHPDVKRAKKKVEVFERAIKEILG